jgi:hypothetical protein
LNYTESYGKIGMMFYPGKWGQLQWLS